MRLLTISSRRMSKSAWIFTHATINLSVHWHVWRNTKFLTISIYLSSIMIVGGIYFPWDINFLKLMVRPKSEHAEQNWFDSVCIFWGEWATKAASSEKSRSRRLIFFTFDFPFRRVGLTILASDIVCSLTSTIGEQKLIRN